MAITTMYKVRNGPARSGGGYAVPRGGYPMPRRIEKSDQQWKAELSPDEYRILREKGTEPPFTGAYVNEKSEGVYRCRACGTPLFLSDAKYDSRSGWPSFWEPMDRENVREEEDGSHGMRRTEVLCAACDAHLGHVFPDGPRPSRLRYCINSASLDLDRAADSRSDPRTDSPEAKRTQGRGE